MLFIIIVYLTSICTRVNLELLVRYTPQKLSKIKAAYSRVITHIERNHTGCYDRNWPNKHPQLVNYRNPNALYNKVSYNLKCCRQI